MNLTRAVLRIGKSYRHRFCPSYKSWHYILAEDVGSGGVCEDRQLVLGEALAEGAVQADLARSYGVSQPTISRLAAPSPFEPGAGGAL
jgi:hypothetical protein